MARQMVAQHEGVQPKPRGRRLQAFVADNPDGVAEQGESMHKAGVFHVSDRPLQFEVIPLVCLVSDVCHFLRLSERQFHYLMARREMALAELEPLDRQRRFTGESVAAEIKRRAARRVA